MFDSLPTQHPTDGIVARVTADGLSLTLTLSPGPDQKILAAKWLHVWLPEVVKAAIGSALALQHVSGSVASPESIEIERRCELSIGWRIAPNAVHPSDLRRVEGLFCAWGQDLEAQLEELGFYVAVQLRCGESAPVDIEAGG